MLIALANSIDRYAPNQPSDGPYRAAMRMLNAAQRRANATGRTMSSVLREHQNAIEDRMPRDAIPRFMRNDRDDGRAEADTEYDRERRRLMDRQDARRAQLPGTLSIATTHAARQVDYIEGQRMLVPHATSTVDHDGGGINRPELAAPAHVATSTSMLRLPAPRDPEFGGETPNADRLRLRGPAGAPENVLRLGYRAPPPVVDLTSDDEPRAGRSMRARASVNYKEADVSSEGGDTYGTRRPGKNLGKIRKGGYYDIYQGG